MIVSEAKDDSDIELLQSLLDDWRADLDLAEGRHLHALAQQLKHIRAAGVRSANHGILKWRCIDELTRVHVPMWIEATPDLKSEDLLRRLGPIVDESSARVAIDVLRDLRSSLADRQRVSREFVQKETWSRAWPSAWNMESSNRWAYARDASLGAAATSSWRAATLAAKRSGFLAIRDAAAQSRDATLDSVCEVLSELTNEVIAEIGWWATWQRTWAIAAASSYVPRVDLDAQADHFASEAINPTSKVLFEETLMFIGELLRAVM